MLFRCVVVSLALIMLFSGCGDNGGSPGDRNRQLRMGVHRRRELLLLVATKGAAGIGKIVNGSFSLSESGEQEGVQPGTYTVLIQSWFEELGSVLPSGGFSPGKRYFD